MLVLHEVYIYMRVYTHFEVSWQNKKGFQALKLTLLPYHVCAHGDDSEARMYVARGNGMYEPRVWCETVCEGQPTLAY